MKKRKLTPIGRITVVKSLLSPLLTHLFISLPSPTNEFMKQLNNTLYEFVWDGTAKIKQTVFTKKLLHKRNNNIVHHTKSYYHQKNKTNKQTTQPKPTTLKPTNIT